MLGVEVQEYNSQIQQEQEVLEVVETEKIKQVELVIQEQRILVEEVEEVVLILQLMSVVLVEKELLF
jgi:hypothetical protein